MTGPELLDPTWFNPLVLLCAVIFPVLHIVVRASKGKKTSAGRCVLTISLGASAPTSLFLACSIVQPTLLAKISDQNILLGVAGLTGLALIIYQLFDLED